MREIKFKGRRVDNGEWVYGYYFKTPLTDEATNSKPEDGWHFLLGRERCCISSQNGCVCEVIPETVGQFTGLKDKNGKEVYEGDILRIPPEDKYEEHTYNSFEVFYHDNDYSPTDCGLVFGRLKPHGNSSGGYSGYKLIPKHISTFVIIGNIHDNLELLKE